MAYDLLTTSGINSLVNDYTNAEATKRIIPLNTRKTRYQNLNTAYSTISTKLSSLGSLLSVLAGTGTNSAFIDKASSSSNTNFVDVTASSSALAGTSSIRINQLAKSDIVLSQDPVSAAANSTITAAGTHSFVLTAGDGSGGTLTSKVDVTFTAGDFTAGVISNQAVMQKIQNAVNSNKAVVNSSSLAGSTLSSGSFSLNLNGTVTAITYSAGTYSSVMDSIVTQINKLSGISASKVVNGSNTQLQISVTDSSKYISIGSDTGTLVSELNIGTTKLKGASGIVSASTFSPTSSTSQLSLTALSSGYDNRILSLTDNVGSSALASVGLNLGSARTSFVQNAGLDTAGYLNASSLLNAKFEFNGIAVERNSNTVTDLLAGQTINLKSVMQSTDTTVSISTKIDSSKINDKIQSFVKTFNDAYTYIKGQSVTIKGVGRGLLVGDSTASSITSMLSNATSTVAGLDAASINSLSKLGITFDTNNGLTVSNTTQLNDAITNKTDQVAALFNSTNGLATTLNTRVSSYIGSSGYLATSQNSFNTSISYLSDSISYQQTRISKSAESLRTSYVRLQTQLSTLLNSQSLFSSSFYTVY